ncbi:hypothetical protein BDZ89DRAFT_668415 [Hymenopellis radicata]|nr:hypothetical protein BDZ89DRAFT_668415 [Hymenopellis radicata]
MLLSTVDELGSIKSTQSPSGRSVLRRLINHLQFHSATATCTFHHDWLATARPQAANWQPFVLSHR